MSNSLKAFLQMEIFSSGESFFRSSNILHYSYSAFSPTAWPSFLLLLLHSQQFYRQRVRREAYGCQAVPIELAALEQNHRNAHNRNQTTKHYPTGLVLEYGKSYLSTHLSR